LYTRNVAPCSSDLASQVGKHRDVPDTLFITFGTLYIAGGRCLSSNLVSLLWVVVSKDSSLLCDITLTWHL
jgi:hypothetical protein